MQPRIIARSLAGTAALGLITANLGPIQHNSSAPTYWAETAIKGLRQGHAQGILIALHPRQGTAVLALADGTLLPLRFHTSAQLRSLHVGDLVEIVTHTHGTARLLVSSWRMLAKGSHWNGGHWNGSHWNGSHWAGSHWNGSHWTFHLRGVVERHVRGDVVEVSGFNGAAVLVHIAQTPVSVATGTAPSSVGVAYAAAAPSVGAGESVDAQIGLTTWGSLVASAVTITALRVPVMAIEGTIVAVNHRVGVITLEDENGLTTTVTLPTTAPAYHAGQSCDISGSMSSSASGSATMHAQSAVVEATPQGPGNNAPMPTPTSMPAAQNTPQATVTMTPRVTAPMTAPLPLTVTATVISTSTARTITPITATATATALDQQGSAILTPIRPIATRTATPLVSPSRTPQPRLTAEPTCTPRPSMIVAPTRTPFAWPTRTPLLGAQSTRTAPASAIATATPVVPPAPTSTVTPLPTPELTITAHGWGASIPKVKG